MTAVRLLFLDQLPTPVGELSLVADEEGKLHAMGFTERHNRMDRMIDQFTNHPAYCLVRAPNPSGLTGVLKRYFEGELDAIDGLAVAVQGTDFQRAAWGALRAIPCGETRSYGEQARHIGRPSAVRAVGLANGSNPVSIVVPCHRVIGARGELTGYGGGLERKRWLLAHERGTA